MQYLKLVSFLAGFVYSVPYIVRSLYLTVLFEPKLRARFVKCVYVQLCSSDVGHQRSVRSIVQIRTRAEAIDAV